MIQGIDVSHHNGAIDWPTLSTSPVRFVFLKATEGLDYVDPTFESNLSAALGSGLVVGAYHFFHPNADPLRQASHFLSTFDNRAEIMTALDVEWTGTPNEWDAVNLAESCRNVRAFLDAVKMRTGRLPFLYFSPAFATQYLNMLPMADIKTWVAKYGDTPPAHYAVWQYSEKGTVPGIEGSGVDLDRFEGTFEELQALAGVSI